MAEKDLDPLDQQILASIPSGEAATYRHIIDSVRSEKTDNGVRYHVDRLVQRGYLRAERILGRVVFYRPEESMGADCDSQQRAVASNE